MRRSLRIGINARRLSGPYGGANQFANGLEDALRRRGHSVVRDLPPGLDLILAVACQDESPFTAYPCAQLSAYLRSRPDCVLVQRINTCDAQRAESGGRNAAVARINGWADHAVFVSAFMRDHYAASGIDLTAPSSVILNGADPTVFAPSRRSLGAAPERIELITHHWSTNPMKGFDVYARLDQLLGEEPWRSKFGFTYVGRLPEGFQLRNSRWIPPLSGEPLAEQLRGAHACITGSRLEAGANHQVEALQCGLPVLYLESGSSGEYCAEYGVGFQSVAELEERLLELRERLPELRRRVRYRTHSAGEMAREYERLFTRLAHEPHRARRAARFIPAAVRRVTRSASTLLARRRWGQEPQLDGFLLGQLVAPPRARPRIGWVVPRIAPYREVLPSTRLRCYDLLAPLARRELSVELHSPWVDYELLVFQKCFGAREQALAERRKAAGARILLDINVDYLHPHPERVSPSQIADMLRMLRLVDGVICSSEHLRSVYAEHAPRADCVDDPLPPSWSRPPATAPAHDRPRIVYCGSADKARDLQLIAGPLETLGRELNVSLLTICERDPGPHPIPHVWLPFRDERLPDLLARADVKVAPRDLAHDYNLGHSIAKIAAPMAAGLPVVASPVPSYRGSPALFAEDHETWCAHLRELIADPERRARLGAEGRSYILGRCSLEVIADAYAGLLRSYL